MHDELKNPSSYREFYSTLSMFHKTVLVLISLSVFGGGCVSIGVGLGRVQKLEVQAAETSQGIIDVTEALKETNSLLTTFIGQGTRWTYADTVNWWKDAKANYAISGVPFHWPEPERTEK